MSRSYVRHITVTLDADTSSEDIEPLLEAIRMLRGVSSVRPQLIDADEYARRKSVRPTSRRKTL